MPSVREFWLQGSRRFIDWGGQGPGKYCTVGAAVTTEFSIEGRYGEIEGNEESPRCMHRRF